MRAETLDDYKRKDLLLDGIRNPTMKQVCYVVLTVRFQPEFLSRPLRGPPSPRGRELGVSLRFFPSRGQDGPPSAVGTLSPAFPTGRRCRQGRKHGQVAIGTDFVGFAEKPVAHWFFKIIQKCEFSNTGKLAIYIDIKVFFKQKLYKVSGFQWTNREFCCIIITFLCRRRKR